MEPAKVEQLLAAQTSLRDAVAAHATKTGEQYIALDGKIKTVDETLGAINGRIKTLEDQLRLRPEGLVPGLGDEAKKMDFNVVRALFNRKSADFALMQEYTAKKRDMSASDDVSGGYLISPVMLPGYVEKARARSVVWKDAGVTEYTGLVGAPIILPIETGDPLIQSVGEVQAPTATDDTVGQVQFTPHRMATLVKMSDRLLRNSALAEQVVRKAITRNVGIKMDLMILRGKGAANEPLGLANTAGINTVALGTNGGYSTFATAQSMVIQTEEANLAYGEQKFVGHPRFFWSMKTERIATYNGDPAGFYTVLPMSDENLKSLLGYEFLKTTAIPKNLSKGTATTLTEGYFGDWSEVHLAMWEDLIFRTSDQAGDSTGSAFTQSQMWLLAELEYDVRIPRPQAFSYVNDALTS